MSKKNLKTSTGQTEYPTMNYGRRLTRNRWFSWEEERGTGLVTHLERVVTALPRKHCSGQHKATEEEGDRRTHGGGSSRMRMKCGWRVSDTAGGRWRRQRRTEMYGDELSVGVTRHKSSQVKCTAFPNIYNIQHSHHRSQLANMSEQEAFTVSTASCKE